MSTQGTFDGEGGTLTGRAPAARIFALVVLSLVVLLGSLLAVRAIGQQDASPRAASPTSAGAPADDSGVLVLPKEEPKPKPEPKPAAKPQRKPQAAQRSSTPVQTSAASSSATATPTPAPAPTPAPTPTRAAPAPTPAPAPKPRASAPAKKPAPVQHTVVVTE